MLVFESTGVIVAVESGRVRLGLVAGALWLALSRISFDELLPAVMKLVESANAIITTIKDQVRLARMFPVCLTPMILLAAEPPN